MSLTFGDFELDQERRQLLRLGQPVSLEPKAYELLTLLVERRPRALSRAQIRDVVWPDVIITESTLGVVVNGIRQALGDDAREPRFIRTVRGFGYAFCGEVRDTTDGQPHAERETAPEPESSPYPGLAAFTEADAASFFGREDEVAALWEKIRRQKLLAVIGPSGVGKTSLLRAGVIPNRPEGWTTACATPGSSPVLALVQALLPGLAGDVEAIGVLLRGGQDPSLDRESSFLSALARWRGTGDHALLVLDQFEELFTLNPSEVQASVAGLLGRLSETDVHVLLCLRDDFLFRCSEHESLRPVFQDITPLRPPSEEALRRALVEPAQRRGVGFEDDRLVEEMVETVGEERGALPLLAFAVSRLWDERDRERKLLTWEAYRRAGGVAGALARHAEATLSRLGPHSAATVREIFRNLVTSEGTRAAREREELLSVFVEEREVVTRAGAVLDALVDARLLTEYDAAEIEGVRGPSTREGDDEETRANLRQVEIVHESLLIAWPRLVQWRAQDDEGAVLRDQLRQAARLWDDSGRPDDLLWTGRTWRQYALWREGYAGGLSSVEDEFASAMTAHASRRHRRRRAALAAALALLATGLTVVTALWGRSETARQKAAAEALRADGGKLLVLGQMALDENPTAALAYAMQSLELADTQEARLFVLRTVQQGPMAFVYPSSELNTSSLEFSANGEWLAVGGGTGAQVLHGDGRAPIVFRDFPNLGIGSGYISVGLAADGRVLVTHRDGEIQAWSVPEGRELWRAPLEKGPTSLLVRGDSFFTSTTAGEEEVVREWSFSGESHSLGTMKGLPGLPVDIHGDRLAHPDGSSVYVRSFDRWTSAALVGEHRGDVQFLAFGPDGTTVAAWDASGEVRLWSAAAPSVRLLRLHEVDAKFGHVGLDTSGHWLSFTPGTGHLAAHLWDLRGPPAAAPIVLRRERTASSGSALHPSGRWIATTHNSEVALWWLGAAQPRVLSGHGEGFVATVAFTPDGTALVSGAQDGTIRRWPLQDAGGEETEVLLDGGETILHTVIVDETRQLLGADWSRIVAVPLEGGAAREVATFSANVNVRALAVSLDGRHLASAPLYGPTEDKVLRVWDLETGAVRSVGPVPDAEQGNGGLVWSLEWLDDESILASVFPAGLVLYDLESGRHRVLSPEPNTGAVLSRGREFGVGVSQSGPTDTDPGVLVRFGLDGDPATAIPSHGDRLGYACVALDPTDTRVATGSADGVVRLGPVTGEEPHVFFGHEGRVFAVAFSPDGRWLASAGADGTVRLWPVPDVSKPPPHTLPRDELLARLRTLTNLRAVPDPESPGGYRIEPGPFPGWAREPEW